MSQQVFVGLFLLVEFAAQLLLPKWNDILIGAFVVDPVIALVIGLLTGASRSAGLAGYSYVGLVFLRNLANYLSYPQTWPRFTIVGGDLEWFGVIAMFTSVFASAISMCGGYFIMRRNTSSPLNRCRNCGYDLTLNLSGQCPECGLPTSGSAAHPIRPSCQTAATGNSHGGQENARKHSE